MMLFRCLISVLSLLVVFLPSIWSMDVGDIYSVGSSPRDSSMVRVLNYSGIESLYEPDCREWTADNRLECWLWQLQVDIPSESFSADWITVSIHGMTCTHFVLRNLQSNYPVLHSIDLSVHTLQATCKGKYYASGGVSGHVEASVSPKSSVDALQVSFRILPSTAYTLFRPWTFETVQCQTQLQATKIHFSGSMSARLIQLFSKMIGHYITQALQDQLCPLLPKALDPLVTSYLHILADWMKPYLPDKISPHHVGMTFSQSLRPQRTTIRRIKHDQATSLPVAFHQVTSTPLTTRKMEESSFLIDANSTIYNPVDWNVVNWTLSLFNRELADHLQQGWLFNSTKTKEFCPHQCQDMFRGLSGWFRSIVGPQLTVLLPTYFHNISLPPLPLQANMSIGFDSISIKGLDRLDVLQLFEPLLFRRQNVSHNYLESRVSTMNGIQIETPMTLSIQMPNTNHALQEPFTLKVNITQFDTVLRTAVQVIDWDNVHLLQVVNAVQLFVEHPTPNNIRPILGCLIHTIQKVENFDWITSIVMGSVSILRRTARLLNASDSLEDDLDHVINTSLKLLLAEYSQLWTELIEGLIQDTARHNLGHFIDDWMDHHSTSHACPAVTPALQPKWLNFSKFLVLDQFNEFLSRPSTRRTMNQYMECVGKFWEGYVAAQANRNAVESSSERPLLKVLRIEAKHWNAIQRVQILQPTDDTTLESSLEWGNNSTVPQLQIMVQVAAEQVSGVVNLTFFTGFRAKLGTKIDYNLNRLENLTVARLLQQIECAMVPLYEVRLLPKVTGADLGSQVGINVSALLNNQSINYSTNESKDKNSGARGGSADMAATVLEWSVEWFRNIVNKALEDWVAQSSSVCSGIIPHNGIPVDNGHEKSSMWYDYPLIWIVILMVIIGQGGILVLVRKSEAQDEADGSHEQGQLTTPLLSQQHEEEILGPLPLENDFDDYNGEVKDLAGSRLDGIRNTRKVVTTRAPSIPEEERFFPDEGTVDWNSLVLTRAIPEIVRFVIPMLIVGTVVLLFSSNVSVGASVDMSIRVGDTPIHLPGLFSFSLGNTISELYGAGIYPLLFLVVVFSGIWPYAKLFWMLYIWNTSYKDDHRREQRLLTLDALSKFSLVDTYVLVVMLVAFRFHLDLAEDLGLDVYVTPKYGFYAFLLATCFSLVLGHGMLHFHRRAERAKYHQDLATDLIEKQSIFDFAFKVDAMGPRRPLSRCFQVITLISCLLAMVFLLLGFGQESFSFEFGGLAGMALGEKNKTSYSVVSLGAAIPKSVEDSFTIGVVLLQAAYFFYAIVTPLACLSFLIILVIYPTTPRVQRRLLIAAEISNAWSAVEVFVLSIVAALFQISTFASFIIGDKCDLINKVAATLIGSDIIPEEDAVCFRVVASVESNSWFLVVGVLLNSFAASLVLKLAHAAVHERAGHLNSDTLPRQLFRLPIGNVLFGPGIEEPALQEDNNEGGNAPAWRFWF